MYELPLRLSQSQLNLLETCPRKFQHIYLEQLTSPISPEQLEKQNWGSQFHLLMQQRELGLPIESILREDEQFAHSFKSLLATAPEILTPTENEWREAEHCRTLQIRDYLLTVIYDLLITNQEKAQIIDWKTYLQPPKKINLANNWQTRLYLYLLTETSTYLPEQISLTYWFVKLPTKPQSYQFNYNSQQHQQTREDLNQLLKQLDEWLERYHNEGIDFPQVNENSSECNYCDFALRCQRDAASREIEKSRNWLTEVDKIEEVSI
ncbi:MAG: PD-(D/E)XK nuclease family protein [Oscillatoria sp. PMC 1068.18]|nr:PD-(D/E)XK nuclease family protein [Oscillatoria sp. PMC 1076.18]MEC4991663.1 PD-(D/E)XK nuclease family protein [Oscillatoria sp. PMC 1068.18]